MMKISKYFAAPALVAIFSISSIANAALVERLGGLAYYDDEADLTWLADANANGAMNWDNANAWAAGLDVAGVTGWRLPDSDACSAYSCTGSEMGNLFYNVLGGSAVSPITTIHNANYDLFSNVQSGYYRSATENALNTELAWLFDMSNGYQLNYGGKVNSYYAWAVQTGDVSAVPVPAAVWLFGSGLIGLIGLAKRKKA